MALSWEGHRHFERASEWWRSLGDDEVFYCRFTQLGLLRLLMTESILGDGCLTMHQAWNVYGQWLDDPHVQFRRDPVTVDDTLPLLSKLIGKRASPKVLGDYYLIALALAIGATLVTFDKAIGRLPGANPESILVL